MIKLSIKLVSVILTLGAISSCSNDDYPSSITTRSCFESNSIANLPSQVAPQNPYGCIGDIHNEFMDSIKMYVKDTSYIRHYAIKFCEKRSDIFHKEALKKPDIDLHCKKSANIGLLAENKIRLDFVADSIINQTSPKVKNKLNVIKGFLNGDNLNNKTRIKTFFETFDKEITNDRTLSTEEKVQILICSAVANASSQYNSNKLITIEARQNIVKADFLGAIGGVVRYIATGGLSGSMIFGPTGIAATLVASAGVGAIISSGLAAGFFWL